jgi:protein-L-isoaspartate O-methyltransferase
MVDGEIARHCIRDPLVPEAKRRVPGEEFAPEELVKGAYEVSPLPVEARQTISLVAAMIAAA